MLRSPKRLFALRRTPLASPLTSPEGFRVRPKATQAVCRVVLEHRPHEAAHIRALEKRAHASVHQNVRVHPDGHTSQSLPGQWLDLAPLIWAKRTRPTRQDWTRWSESAIGHSLFDDPCSPDPCCGVCLAISDWTSRRTDEQTNGRVDEDLKVADAAQ